jgi:hypothetical protein
MPVPLRGIPRAVRAKLYERRLRRGYEQTSVDALAAAYSGLHPLSLALSSLAPTAGLQRPKVHLLVPEGDPSRIFAGVRTAIEFGGKLAGALEFDLDVIAFAPEARPAALSQLAELARKLSASTGTGRTPQVSAFDASILANLPHNPLDVWVVTHWTTAFPARVAANLGRLDPSRVVYLIQDYEPAFHAWGSSFALSQSTYASPFVRVVNSSPVADYLRRFEGVSVPSQLVFAPELDLERLQASADARHASDRVRVLFYARPSRPRNLFAIGYSALSLLSERWPDKKQIRISTIGEQHGARSLGAYGPPRVLGKLSWEGYFAELADTDVFLSLQQSPHPSHPPLDAVTSGAFAVTNDLGGSRADLHERLGAVASNPESLAEALEDAVRRTTNGERHGYDDAWLARLGAPMAEVITRTAQILSVA